MNRWKRKKIYPCIIKGCPGRDTDDISLYAIPPNDVEAWCFNLQMDPSDVKTTTRVCSRHFQHGCRGTFKLKAGARPTIQLGPRVETLPYVNKRKCNTRKCSVQNCDTTAPPYKLYSFPSDPYRYEEWISICPLKETTLEFKHKYICAKHFHPSAVTENRIKSNAVPLPPHMQPKKPKKLLKKKSHKKKIVKQIKEESPEPIINIDPIGSQESDGYSSDCLECRSGCNVCHNSCDVYINKYIEAKNEIEEVKSMHLIETQALKNQIDELTNELKNAGQRRKRKMDPQFY